MDRDPVMRAIDEAEQRISDWDHQRMLGNLSLEARNTNALEAIADALTRLHAEVTAVRCLLAASVAKNSKFGSGI